jgi:hypothetical protein
MMHRLDIRARRLVRNAHLEWLAFTVMVSAQLHSRRFQDRVLYLLLMLAMGMLFGGVFQ